MNDRPWNSPQYKAWRLAVYRRDGFKCKMPGCGSKKRLNAHHIRRYADFPAIRFLASNGITLCRACHGKVWGKEEEFESLFTSLISRGDIRLQMLMLKYAKR